MLYDSARYHVEYALHTQASNILANLWPPSWRAGLDLFDVRALLVAD